MVVPDDLKARCAEILDWQWTGILSGNALRDFAAAHYSGHHDALQMAERTTAREAYAALAAAPAQEQAAQGEATAAQLETAWRDGWARCRDAEQVGQEAEDWAFGQSQTNSLAVDATQLAGQGQKITLSAQVREFLQEAINDATHCEEADMDVDFAEELGKLLDPIYAAAPIQAQEDARDGHWLTVVYRDVAAGDEARDLCAHPKVSAMSWSHALNDRDAARAAQGGAA